MIEYLACFLGREIGDTEESRYLNVNVNADNMEEAKKKLAATHEHFGRLLWLWPGKQTVCKHSEHDLARTVRGFTHYVSTYNGDSWCQTSCTYEYINEVKAAHLADTEFMNRYRNEVAA